MIPASAPDLVARVAAAYDLPVAALTSQARDRYTAAARHAAMWLLRRRYPDLSMLQIGRMLGRTDHTTVVHALGQVEAKRQADPAFAARLDALLAPAT